MPSVFTLPRMKKQQKPLAPALRQTSSTSKPNQDHSSSNSLTDFNDILSLPETNSSHTIFSHSLSFSGESPPALKQTAWDSCTLVSPQDHSSPNLSTALSSVDKISLTVPQRTASENVPVEPESSGIGQLHTYVQKLSQTVGLIWSSLVSAPKATYQPFEEKEFDGCSVNKRRILTWISDHCDTLEGHAHKASMHPGMHKILKYQKNGINIIRDMKIYKCLAMFTFLHLILCVKDKKRLAILYQYVEEWKSWDATRCLSILCLSSQEDVSNAVYTSRKSMVYGN
ncbi:hypothetical protein BJ138DRAFT_1116590 [Hygrophoropsis aurantiaca]|uniref:Uncharacterized protein n=1 Tax=Hygrophoropsis aurantiaca TaxID=72124 RepID=A0ACB8A3D5_9AGAM|nr:hypothetical protein BJ138DRAFT_1116590 [Hygrophoropsis aurantiaca]